MKHDYTDEEIRTAWKDSLSLRAFLAALPERPQAQPGPWPGQQEAIDAAFEQQGNYYLAAHPSHNEWESDASDRLAIAQAYDAARPQAAEIAALKAELAEAIEARDELDKDVSALLRVRDERDKAQAELAALRQPILADDGRSLVDVYHKAWTEAREKGAPAALCITAAVQAVAAVVLAQAVRRMEAVPGKRLLERFNLQSCDGASAMLKVADLLIAAAKGEGQGRAQAKPSTRVEITEIPDKKPGPVGTLAYAPQAEALPSTQQNKSESSALEKQAVQEAAYILNHYDRKSHADHICLGKKLIREGWKGPNFGKQKSDLKLTLHRSAAEDTPQAEAKAEPAKLLGQHGPKGAPALCGPSANPVVVNEPPKSEGQPDLSGESEKQDPYARLTAYAQAGARISYKSGPWRISPNWHFGGPAELYFVHPDDLHMVPEYDPQAEPTQFQPEPAQPWTPDNAKSFEEFQAELRQTWDSQPTTSPGWTPAVGDVVRLKSGGPVMTVTDVDPLSLMCAWMNADNELQVEPITTLCLTPVPAP